MSERRSETTQEYRRSRTLFWVTFVSAAVASLLLDQTPVLAAVVAVSFMAVYLLVSRFWTPAVLQHPDFADGFYFLGFLLTLVALVATLVGLGQVDDDQVRELVLGRFGLALATTIVGLTVRTALRMFQEAAEDSLLDEMERVQAETKRAAERLRLTLHNLGTDLQTTLGGTATRIDQAVGDVTGRMKTLSDGLAAAGARLEPWASALQSVHDRTAGLQQSFGATEAAGTSLSQGLQMLEARAESLSLPLKQTAETLEGFSAAAESASARAKELEEISSAVRESLESLKTVAERLGDLPAVTGSLEQVAGTVQGVVTALDGLSTSASRSGAALDGVKRRAQELDADALGRLTNVARLGADALDGVLARWTAANEELATATAELSKQERAATESLVSVRDELVSVRDELVAGVGYLAGLVEEDAGR